VTWRFLALGGGVQSSVLALMADQGIFDAKPDAAIHADTQWDPPETMATVAWLAETLSYPVHVVTAGSLKDDIRRGYNSTGHRYVSLPTYTVHRTTGAAGMSRRQCTSEYKIKPQTRLIRELMGLKPRQRAPKDLRAERWLGISYDELDRMSDAEHAWEIKRYPLIELRMTRGDCLDWWADNAPADAPALYKSSCVGCPYHDRRAWVDLQDRHPDLIAEAAEIDHDIRANRNPSDEFLPFLHQRRIPLLDAINLDRRRVANEGAQLSLFAAPSRHCTDACDT